MATATGCLKRIRSRSSIARRSGCAIQVAGVLTNTIEAGLGDRVFRSGVRLAALALRTAIGLAILRHGLFDIGVIVRRTLVYSALIVCLSAVYVLTAVGLQALFVAITGFESPLAVVASALAIAVLFRPLYRGIERVIDRRFYRRAYDSAMILDVFAGRVQQDTDLDALSRDVVAIVEDALEPESVTLWLDPGRR